MSGHPVDVHVGKRLRQRRTVLGLSQEALAKAIGITFQQVQKYERGVNRMSASRLYEFAKFMNVPAAFFFEGLDDLPEIGEALPAGLSEATTPAFEHRRVSDRESLEMMKAYNRIMDPTVRRKMSDLVRAVADNALVMSDKVA